MDDTALQIRPARPDDLNLLVWIDVKDEGVSSTYMAHWADDEWARHRALISSFINSPDKVALIAESEDLRRVGAVYARLRNREIEGYDAGSISLCLDRDFFPADGRFCEIFQLWVDPALRRRGIGSKLKLALEREAKIRGVTLICTATEAQNTAVVALNEKLGYRAVRIGPVWDEVPRMSLIKHL